MGGGKQKQISAQQPNKNITKQNKTTIIRLHADFEELNRGAAVFEGREGAAALPGDDGDGTSCDELPRDAHVTHRWLSRIATGAVVEVLAQDVRGAERR